MTLTSKHKTLTITPEWTVNGRYGYVFQTESPGDRNGYLSFLEQIRTANPLPDTLRVSLQTPGNPVFLYSAADAHDAADRMTLGSTIDITFQTKTVFYGFEALLADYFSIDRAVPGAQADYAVAFPGAVYYQVRVEQDGRKFQNQCMGDRFQWSAAQVQDLNIAITTARSWQSIARCYQALYNERYGPGIENLRVPGLIAALSARSRHEKVYGVLDFLKREIRYETRIATDHLLVPDPPMTTLARGWGDCKDMALLGCTLMEWLGIEADILLTGKSSTSWAGQLPDPFIFSHALLTVTDSCSVLNFDVTTGKQVAGPGQDTPSLYLKVPSKDFND
ncbi:MAG: hypothetical protein V1793_19540 [Pseudomonadota bacterium]